MQLKEEYSKIFIGSDLDSVTLRQEVRTPDRRALPNFGPHGHREADFVLAAHGRGVSSASSLPLIPESACLQETSDNDKDNNSFFPLRCPQCGEEMGANGRSYAEKSLSLGCWNGQLVRILERCVSNH